MADIEKVLQELPNISEMLYQMYKDETDKESISVRCDQYLAVDDAIELLKAQQPRVLSYKEVMESDFVFIELYTDEKDGVEPEFIRAIPLFISYTQPDFVTQYEICGHGTWEEYMYNWRCWTAIPTEEQRKAEPWKDGGEE